MRARWIGLVFVAGFLCLPCRAEDKLEPPDLARYLRWGPLRARPSIELSNFGYDNNILYTNLAPIGDWTATVSPALDGLVLFGSRAFLTFTTRFELTGYLDNPQLNYWNHRGKARLTVPLKKFGLFGDLVLNNITLRPQELEAVRRTVIERGLGFGVIFQPGWRTEIELARTFTRWRNTETDLPVNRSNALDRDDLGVVLAIGYGVRGRTTITLDSFVNKLDFLSSPRDSDEWGVLPGVKFGEGGTLTGSGRIGWGEILPHDPRLDEFKGVIGDAEMVYRPVPRMRLRFRLVRLPFFAVFEDAAYYVETRFGVGAVHYFTRILGVELRGETGRLTFSNTISRPREDRTVAWDAGIRIRMRGISLGRRLEYFVRAGRFERTSTVPVVENSRATFGFGIVAGY